MLGTIPSGDSADKIDRNPAFLKLTYILVLGRETMHK